VLVWRLRDRSLADLVATLQELTDLDVPFVSFTERHAVTRLAGPAMAGMLSVSAAFEHDILRDHVAAPFDPRGDPRREHAIPRISASYPVSTSQNLDPPNALRSAEPPSPVYYSIKQIPKSRDSGLIVEGLAHFINLDPQAQVGRPTDTRKSKII
jgi:hypothetical protein